MKTQADATPIHDRLTLMVKTGLCRCWLKHLALELDTIRPALDDDAGRKAAKTAFRHLLRLDKAISDLLDVLAPCRP